MGMLVVAGNRKASRWKGKKTGSRTFDDSRLLARCSEKTASISEVLGLVVQGQRFTVRSLPGKTWIYSFSDGEMRDRGRKAILYFLRQILVFVQEPNTTAIHPKYDVGLAGDGRELLKLRGSSFDPCLAKPRRRWSWSLDHFHQLPFIHGASSNPKPHAHRKQAVFFLLVPHKSISDVSLPPRK